MFDNIYHFELGSRERASLPRDAPYTAKSSALNSEQFVSIVLEPNLYVSYDKLISEITIFLV